MTETSTGRQRPAWGRGGDRLLAGIGAVLLVVHLAVAMVFPKPGGRVVVGDATHHFVQLRSLVFDHDLNFRNEYMRLYGIEGETPGTDWIFRELTPTGHVRNYMPIGPALLWAPLYLLVALVQLVGASLDVSSPPDGFGWAFQMVPGVTGVVAATLATIVTWRLAERFTNAVSALAATVAVWMGAHALYYSLVSPSYSHAPSMLTSALFFSYWLSPLQTLSLGRLTAMGALAGAATLMRWQDVVFLAVPLIEAATWRARWSQRLTGAIAAVLAWGVVFSPQMAVWHVLYGRALAVPQGSSFMQWTAPHPIAVLFSFNHGLFTWAPLLIVACAGLVVFARRHPALAPPLIAVVVASWYVNAAVRDWWAGEAFGARRFLSLFPLFVIGMAIWLQAQRRPVRVQARRFGIAALFVVANGLLLLQYQLFMKGLAAIAPYPGEWFSMWLARFVVPLRLLGWWLG